MSGPRTITHFSAARSAELAAQPLTYDEVGATRGEGPVPGYHWFRRTVRLAPGAASFAKASADLMTWQVQLRAGLKVSASAPEAAVGEVVNSTLGIGPFGIPAPCRVVYVISEPRAAGYGYGTLPGHAEAGEEAFVVDHHEDDSVTFTITAFSRPATWLTKLGGPIARQVQKLMTNRYLRALQ